VRPKIAAAAGLLLAAAPGTATAGNVTPVQFAYGGGSNAAAVIASRPATSGSGQSTQPGAAASSQGGGGSTAGSGQSGGTGGTGGSGSGSGRAGAGSGGGGPEKTAQPLVGLAGGAASPAGSFDAFHRAVPRDAVWAIGLAVACAVGAWLIRRRSA
jgi:hypothetical protein